MTRGGSLFSRLRAFVSPHKAPLSTTESSAIIDPARIADKHSSLVQNWGLTCLSFLHLFSLYCMYGLLFRNGYVDALLRLRDYGPHVLPGTDLPILTKFSGIGPLDRLLTLGGILFHSVTSGISPHVSLYAFQFSGQLVPVFTTLLIEGGRRGNRTAIDRALSSPLLVGLAMQSLGYGVVMPLYGIANLLSSPTAGDINKTVAEAIRPQDTSSVELFILSIITGYIVPTIVMVLPLPSTFLHQWLGGFWQGCPIWISLAHYGLNYHRQGFQPEIPVIQNKSGLKDGTRTKQCASWPSSRIKEKMVLQKAYVFAFGMAGATHIMTVVAIITRKLLPSLFSLPALESFSFQKVFVPPVFYSKAPMESMADGIQNFLQYDQYIGSTAAIVWAVELHIRSQRAPLTVSHWLRLSGAVFGISLIGGPAAAVLSLMWNRDERILSHDSLFLSSENPDGHED